MALQSVNASVTMSLLPDLELPDCMLHLIIAACGNLNRSIVDLKAIKPLFELLCNITGNN